MTRGLLEFLQKFDEDSTFYPSVDEITMAKRLFDGWKFVVLDDSGLTGKDRRFWMFNQVLYWDPALAVVLMSYRTRSEGAKATSADLRPQGHQLHEHIARAFGYTSTVPHCVLIAHLLEPLVKRYDEFNVFQYARKGHDKNLNQQHWLDLFLRALGRRVVVQDVCRCLFGYDSATHRRTFPADLQSGDGSTTLHPQAPPICAAFRSGRPYNSYAPVTQSTAVLEGNGQMYGILHSEIQQLFVASRQYRV